MAADQAAQAPLAAEDAEAPRQTKDDYMEHVKDTLAKYLPVAHSRRFWVVFLICWVTFVFTYCMFTWNFMSVPYVCWTFDFMILVAAGIWLMYNYNQLRGGGSSALPIFVGCLIAIVFGTVLGLFTYDTYAIFPMFYDNTRKYTNVVASEPSAAISDAGKIIFNMQTRVDLNKSIGLVSESGTLYCVAPLTDPSKQPRIEFWAAGIDCCTATGGFKCDAALSNSAEAGIRVFNNNNWFPFTKSRFLYYQQARAKAEAEYGLQSVGNPMYIRWVEKGNLNMLHNYYKTWAIVWTILFSIIFLFTFALYSFFTWKPPK